MKKKNNLVAIIIALVVAFILLTLIIPSMPEGSSALWNGFRGFFVDANAAILGGWQLVLFAGGAIYLGIYFAKKKR